MSRFWNNTNNTRVGKMVETLSLIEKSAQVNKAEADEIAEMLAPLMDKLQAMGTKTPVIAEREVTAPSEPTIAAKGSRFEPDDKKAYLARVSARDFVESRPDGDAHSLMDVVHVALDKLGVQLDMKGGK